MGFLSLDQAATRMGVCHGTAYAMCRRYEDRWRTQNAPTYEPPPQLPGELMCIRVGLRKLRVPEAALERMGL